MPKRPPPRRSAVLLLVLLVSALSGCGSSVGPGGSSAGRNVTLVLDFTPNAVHAGIYSAAARGFDRGLGIHLRVVAPGASTDSVRLLESGRATAAILDIHDLALAQERGQDVVGVMAIVERPLAAVIAAPSITTPRRLTDKGQPIGVTGLPSDNAVLRSIVLGAGGDARRLHPLTIGFDAVPDLLSGRVAAATAFWDVEGVTLARRRPGFHVFRVDDFGAPAYPELVLCVTRARLRREPAVVRATVRALVQGYGLTVAHPQRSAADLRHQVPGLDPGLIASELAALGPAFRARDGRIGELDPGQLGAWSRWEVRFGVVSRPPDLRAMFDPRPVAAATGARTSAGRPALTAAG